MFVEPKITDNGQIVFGTDKSLFVEFYNVRELQTKQITNTADPSLAGEVVVITDENGQFVYKNVPYIRIVTPGSKTTVVERPVKFDGDHIAPSDTQRFSEQWERFRRGEEQKQNGHSLTELGLGEKEIRAFAEYSVHTVEQLLNVPDVHLTNITLGARSIREKARTWLENRKEADSNRVDHEAKIEAQQARIDALEAQVNALLAASAPSEEAKKRGRPAAKIDTTPPFPTDQQFL